MNRRLTVAVAATAALGLAAGGVASAGAAGKASAPKKNEIVIKGKFVFKAGYFAHDDQRFKPLSASVKSGATVTVRNKSKAPDPHTITFIESSLIPDSFESPIIGATFAAHQPGGEEAPLVVKLDDGVPAADQSAPLAVNTLGTLDAAGDSEFMDVGQKKTTFVVTAAKGATLPFFCAIHPWMQGKIKVK